jgi:hypothetical protein
VPGSHGERTDSLILEILRNSRSPERGPVIEALICDGDEAMAAIEKGRLGVRIYLLFDGPIQTGVLGMCS